MPPRAEGAGPATAPCRSLTGSNLKGVRWLGSWLYESGRAWTRNTGHSKCLVNAQTHTLDTASTWLPGRAGQEGDLGLTDDADCRPARPSCTSELGAQESEFPPFTGRVSTARDERAAGEPQQTVCPGAGPGRSPDAQTHTPRQGDPASNPTSACERVTHSPCLRFLV